METKMDKNYDHQKVEEGKFAMWKENGYFAASGKADDKRPAFSMIIPPPNVTGVLHVGHALDAVLHDILARYKRLNGYDVSFVPGTDHAGIATQAKVEANLRKQGISRYDLGREKFIAETFRWKDESSQTIHAQWQAMGIGMDYGREFFTMDQKTSAAVRKVFKSLYDQGLIYQGERIINWDVQLQTALSDIEVEHKDIPGVFYYFRYRLAEDPKKFFVVATTRPETMFGDVCLVYNPKDSRYKGLEGKYAINPANGEKLPFIADYYVDKDFGTGLMKCTPAHDPNDFAIAQRHQLKMPICMGKDGKMNALAGVYQGLDRYDCREKLVARIKEEGNLVKEENITHSVGHSERSGTVVEPVLSKQWFISMKPLADKVFALEKTGERIKFFPPRFEKVFLQWLKNTQDWCISRQLWWGHRIPVFTNKKTGEVVCSETDLDPALWDQDPDVLDTWFSSGLSPFVLANWPQTDDPYFQRYYPLDVMITAYDIIFFWVARMAFDGAFCTGRLPFKSVFIHGLVRDEQGRKMSKSLGNGIDPIKVIDEYGVDSLRFGLATAVTPGLDFAFGTSKIEASHVFLNKVWNASRFVIMNFPEGFKPQPKESLKLDFIDEYLYKNLDRTIRKVSSNIDKYEIGQAANYIYSFIYDVFCSNYIEEAKVDLNGTDQKRKGTVLSVLYDVLKKVLIMLFPYAPFISEEIYSYLPEAKKSIYEESYPQASKHAYREAELGEELVEMVKYVRQFKADSKLAPNAKVNLTLTGERKKIARLQPYLMKLAFASGFQTAEKGGEGFRYIGEIGLKAAGEETHESQELIAKRIEALKAELERSRKILTNPQFLQKAPAAKVQEEKDKQAKYQAELDKYLAAK
jgi:valyl-tRNA synthetase